MLMLHVMYAVVTQEPVVVKVNITTQTLTVESPKVRNKLNILNLTLRSLAYTAVHVILLF